MISFELPIVLWLLAAFPVLVWRIFAMPAKPIHSYSNIELLQRFPKSLRQKFHALVPCLFLFAFASTVVALAQPYTKDKVYSEQAEGIAIVMVVDVSTSMDMNVDEQRVSRMSVAKKALEQFVMGDGESLAGRVNDLISVITFARYPDLLVPFTRSHETLVSMTNDITTSNRPNEDGTAFGDATALAAAQLSHYEESLGLKDNSIKSKVIILLTDGENNSGNYEPLMAAAMAEKWGIKIYTISLGESHNNSVKARQGSQLTFSDNMGDTDWVLQAMAKSTGGIFQRAYDYKSLQQVYAAIDALETSNMQQVIYEQRQPSFQIPALLALLSLFTALILSATWLRKQ